MFTRYLKNEHSKFAVYKINIKVPFLYTMKRIFKISLKGCHFTTASTIGSTCE